MIRFGQSPLLAILVATVLALSAGNASAGKLKDSFSKVFKKEKYENIPKDQVPHTLLIKPVAGGELSSEFGVRINPKGLPIPKKHKGIDYKAPKGTEVFAAGEGIVISKRVSKSYGNFIKISHDNGFASAYAHMDRFSENIKEGTEVQRGDVIGYVGNTGRSTNPHLHYELIYRGKKINPLFAQAKKSRFKFKFKSKPEPESEVEADS